MVCFFKKFRCLNAENLGSVGQRAAKLLAVKVGGLKKKSAGRPRPQSASLLGFDSRSRSNHSESLMAGNFAAHWPTDPKFSALKHLNFLKKHTKNQEASSILRVVFTLSKWPHLHRETCYAAVSYEHSCIENLKISIMCLKFLKFKCLKCFMIHNTQDLFEKWQK